MADQGLKYTISATDKSDSALGSALSNLNKFRIKATGLVTAPFRAITSLKGLGLQANIRLVQSMVGQLDSFIDRGARMAATQKSFIALTGRSEQAAMRLARRLQEQSNGALTLARSMELANRGLSSGMSAGDIGTTFDFISKKAFTTGTRLESALEKVMTGLIRGSTLFLDDFGVLVDGVEQVRRDFDAIHGKKAFDQLGPAAQKAEIIRAAIADMNRQMSAFGVTGKESAFQWARIKSSVKGAVDQLAGAVVKSDAMRGVLTDVSTLVTNITRGLEGKDASKTLAALAGGARKIFGAIFIDVGRLLTKELLQGAKVFGSAILRSLVRVVDYLGQLGGVLIDKLMGNVQLLMDKVPGMGLGKNERLIATVMAGRPLPGLPKVPDLGKLFGDDKPPFANTAGAWADMIDRFKNSGFGKDDMEKQSDAARRKRTFYERRNLERERLGIDRELASLQRRGDGSYSVSEMRHGRDVFARDLQENPELARLGGKDRRARLMNILAEERAARMKQLQERKRLIGEEMARANQPNIEQAPPKFPQVDWAAMGGDQKPGGRGLMQAIQENISKMFGRQLMLLGGVALPFHMVNSREAQRRGVPTSQPATTQPAGETPAAKHGGVYESLKTLNDFTDRAINATGALIGTFDPSTTPPGPPASMEDFRHRYGAEARPRGGGRTGQAIEAAATATEESAEHLRVASETMLASAMAGRQAATELMRVVGVI